MCESQLVWETLRVGRAGIAFERAKLVEVKSQAVVEELALAEESVVVEVRAVQRSSECWTRRLGSTASLRLAVGLVGGEEHPLALSSYRRQQS
jgi:hypothetical protein